MLRRVAPPRLFAFAGLWEVWLGPDGSELYTVTIITTTANAFMAPYHHRMPVILDPADYAAWLCPDECAPDELLVMLRPLPAEMMEAFAVSMVNNTLSE